MAPSVPTNLDDIARFAVALARYRHLTGASVTSWGRTTRRNALVGGTPDSHHLTDTAADVVYDTYLPLRTAQELAADLGLFVFREVDHDHIHLSPKEA